MRAQKSQHIAPLQAMATLNMVADFAVNDFSSVDLSAGEDEDGEPVSPDKKGGDDDDDDEPDVDDDDDY